MRKVKNQKRLELTIFGAAVGILGLAYFSNRYSHPDFNYNTIAIAGSVGAAASLVLQVGAPALLSGYDSDEHGVPDRRSRDTANSRRFRKTRSGKRRFL